MEYWQDLYHELEQQKERGLREGKREGTIEGAQQALIVSIFIYIVLLMALRMMKENADASIKYPHEFLLNIYHIAIIAISIFFLVKALVKDNLLIGNLSLEEARTEGTKWAYVKSWILQKGRYHTIWLTLIISLNSVLYWMIASLLHNLNPEMELFKIEAFAIIAMIVLNVAFVIFTSVLKR